MSYSSEFNVETYPCHIPKFLLKEPWQDISWHNDTCPSFWHPVLKVKVFVDFDNLDDRELEEGCKYMVENTDEESSFVSPFFETDDENELRDRVGKTLPERS